MARFKITVEMDVTKCYEVEAEDMFNASLVAESIAEKDVENSSFSCHDLKAYLAETLDDNGKTISTEFIR